MFSRMRLAGAIVRAGLLVGLGLVTSVGLAGCTPQVCGRSTDCASGLVCTASGACLVPADASTGDAAPVEIDAGVSVIRDADGDAYDIEPIDAPPPGAADAQPGAADAQPPGAADANLIDAPNDDGLSTRRTADGAR